MALAAVNQGSADTRLSDAAGVDSNEKVNVLLVTTGLGLGGAETVIRHLVESIDRRRFNVTVCCMKVFGVVGRELERAGVDIVCLSDSSQSRVDYLTALKLRKLIRARGIDVVHTHTTEALADAAACKLLMPSLRVIHTFHFGNYPHLDKRMMWMERIFSRLADRIIAVGDVQRSQLRAVYGFREDRIGVVWNGVASAPSRADGAFRAEIGADNCVLIGTIATLIEQKGLRDLLEVAARLRDYGDKVRFVVVGEGHLRAELEAKRRELGLDETVVFAGWVPGAAQVALPEFDIFFQPSLWEAMSVAILEAMAAEKPIVATRVGENPRILVDGVHGLLVAPNDVDGMASALRRLIDAPRLRERLGAAAAANAAQRFTVAHMTRTYEQIYLDAVR